MARIEILDYETAADPSGRLLAGAGNLRGEWLFLGDDYRKLRDLRRQLADRLPERDIAAEFHAAAGELRIPFVDYVSSYARARPGFRICSGFCERNPFQSRVFQDLCYLSAARKAASAGSAEPLFVICQEEALARDLARSLGEDARHEVLIRTSGRFPPGRAGLAAGLFLDVIPRATFHALTLVLRKAGSRRMLRHDGLAPGSLENCIVVHTWVSESTCAAAGYRELYFSDLVDWLAEKGHSCILLPHLPHGKTLSPAPYLRCLGALEAAGKRFIPEESLLGLREICSIWLRAIPNFPREESHRIGDLSFGCCVYKQDLRDWTGLSAFYPLVARSLVKGMGKKGIHPRILVLLHENYSWEKMLVHALRRWQPGTTVIGYLHTTPSRNFLMHCLSGDSPDAEFLPDIIVTNGPFTARFLTDRNYPRERVIPGGALRYSALMERARSAPPENPALPPAVLVALPLDGDESVELLDKVYEALGHDTGIAIWCKPHPFLPPDILTQALPPGAQDRIRITKEPLESLLPKVGVLIYSTSISCIDALAMGVPVLKVMPERRIDIDPVGECRGKTPFIRAARTMGEIAGEVHAILGHRFTTEERAWLARLMAGIFSPVTGETYALFTREWHPPGP
jgi:hypothetical protein